MTSQTEVLIAIQARTHSPTFPGKIAEFIGRRRVLDHVIDRAKSAANHVSRFPKDRNLRATVAVLHPDGDKSLVDTFRSSDCFLIGGPDEDVLSRFVKAQQMTAADYVVRLTADCPLILDFVIVKHINSATFKGLDFVSNCYPECRSFADGFDCEIMSKKALEWLDHAATSKEDREHVTSLLYKNRPPELSRGFVSSKLDTSSMKMSLDTPEDLERMRAFYHEREHKMNQAERIFGKSNVFEL